MEKADKAFKSSSDAPQDMLKDAKAVNGGAQGFLAGYNRDCNCAFCATAYEMRRRGKDVQSQESLSGVDRNASKKAFIGLKQKDVHQEAVRNSYKTRHLGMTSEEFDSMESTILKDGQNSRGRIGCQWKAPYEGGPILGGHAFNYEVKNGKFYIVDTQVGQVVSGQDAKNYMKSAINVEHYRTDNLKINNSVAGKYFVEKKSEIRINSDQMNAYKAAAKAEKVTAIASAMGGLSYASGMIGFAVTGNPAFMAAGVAGVTGSGVVTASAQNKVYKQEQKAKEARERESIKLEKKWNDEHRYKFYEYGERGKESGKKKGK